MAKRGEDRDYIIRLAAEIGAQTALKQYENAVNKAKAERVDRRLRNTKLLLRNYRMFKTHAENAIYDAADIDETAYDILDLMSDRGQDSDAIVESIRQSVARTVVIVAHIDTMLGLYETYCAKAGLEEMRRWGVIQGLYIADPPMTAKELANNFCVTERTIYRDVDIATERLTALLFGIDGVRKA